MNTSEAAPYPVLAEHAYRIRRNALRMGEVQGQGYIGQALDIADVLAVAYFRAMRYRARRSRLGRPRPLPAVQWPLCDCAVCGAVRSRLHRRRRTGNLRQRRQPPADVRHGELHAGHGDVGRLARPGSDDRGGPLPRSEAQGLGRIRLHAVLRWRTRRRRDLGRPDVGRALEARQPDRDGRRQQPAGRWSLVARSWRSSRSSKSFEAFGWFTQRMDGNDLAAVVAAFDAARTHPQPQPRIIVCDTRMGCGVPFLEEREKNHFIRVDAHEWQLALAALEAGRQA